MKVDGSSLINRYCEMLLCLLYINYVWLLLPNVTAELYIVLVFSSLTAARESFSQCNTDYNCTKYWTWQWNQTHYWLGNGPLGTRESLWQNNPAIANLAPHAAVVRFRLLESRSAVFWTELGDILLLHILFVCQPTCPCHSPFVKHNTSLQLYMSSTRPQPGLELSQTLGWSGECIEIDAEKYNVCECVCEEIILLQFKGSACSEQCVWWKTENLESPVGK